MAPSSVPSGVVSSDAVPAAKARAAPVANRKKVATPAVVESKIVSMPTSQGNKKDDSDSGGGYTTI